VSIERIEEPEEVAVLLADDVEAVSHESMADSADDQQSAED
jgi:hypothetical protein